MAKNRDGGGSSRGMNSKGKTVGFVAPKGMPQLKNAPKPTEAITAKGQKATGLGKSAKDNRFASTAKTPVQVVKEPSLGDVARFAATVFAATKGKGNFSRWSAGKLGGLAEGAAFQAASKGLSASGKGGKVLRTVTPMGPTLRSTRIGSPAQQAARMENLLKNASKIGTQTGQSVAQQTMKAVQNARKTARSVAATAVTADVVRKDKKKKK